MIKSSSARELQQLQSVRGPISNFFWPVLAVFCIRLMFVAYEWGFHGRTSATAPDSAGYVLLAKSLTHGTFEQAGVPEINRTPGYPLTLVPGVLLGDPVLFGALSNSLLCVLSGVLIWKITSEECGSRTAAAAATLLFAFEPLSILFSNLVLTETLFSFQMLLAIFLLLRNLRAPRKLSAIAAGLAFGVSAYTRPVSQYLAAAVILLLVFLPRLAALKSRLQNLAFFAFSFALTVTPWIVRNKVKADFFGLSSISDRALYFYSAAAVEARLQKKSFVEMQNELGWSDSNRYFQAHPDQRSWSQGQIVRYRRSAAKQILAEHVWMYGIMHFQGTLVVVLDPGTTDILKAFNLYPEQGGLLGRVTDQGLVRASLWLFRAYPIAVLVLLVMGLQLALLYGLTVFGLRGMRLEPAVVFATLFLYFIAVCGGPVAIARYRHPLMPFVCICAGIGFVSARKAILRGDASLGFFSTKQFEAPLIETFFRQKRCGGLQVRILSTNE